MSCIILFCRAFKTLNSRVVVARGSVNLRLRASYFFGLFLLNKYKKYVKINVIYQIEYIFIHLYT